MPNFVYLRCINGTEIVVNESHIVKLTRWGETYKIFLLDGNDHTLDMECGSKIWNDLKNKSYKGYCL